MLKRKKKKLLSGRVDGETQKYQQILCAGCMNLMKNQIFLKLNIIDYNYTFIFVIRFHWVKNP